jgi:hypothetical protein
MVVDYSVSSVLEVVSGLTLLRAISTEFLEFLGRILKMRQTH